LVSVFHLRKSTFLRSFCSWCLNARTIFFFLAFSFFRFYSLAHSQVAVSVNMFSSLLFLHELESLDLGVAFRTSCRS
jgi:ABC-type long-subunit fatty acid transport system fused permease/ATPase subunit